MSPRYGFAGSALHGLDQVGAWFGLVGLRMLLGYEFFEAGMEKLGGQNWFSDIQDAFPFPFNLFPVGLSWFLATWTEIIGAIALVLGIGTRFWSAGLIVLTAVAWVSVHAGNGYNVCDNGYKLPLVYVAMLLPLVLMGPGKLSVDATIRRRWASA